MKVLSLFDGISCGQIALNRANIPVDEYHSFEIDRCAKAITQFNFPKTIQHGNVFNNDFTELKDIDLLIGGSPCTFWSIAKSNREVDKNGCGWQLFMKYVDALKQVNPCFFLYENVASMPLSIKTYISEELKVLPIEINSSLLSAQQRKRLYWTNIPLPSLPLDTKVMLEDILESGVCWQKKSYALTANYSGAVIWNTLERHQRTMIAEPIRLGTYGSGGQGQRIYSVKGKSVALSANGGGQGAKTGLYKIDLPDGNYLVRKLTPIEAERCQTLPNNYTEFGADEKNEVFTISNTQRYKCIGNGWTVDVISYILRHMKTGGYNGI